MSDELKSITALLESMNKQQLAQSRRIAALELLAIGLLRAAGSDPDDTLHVERSLAEFSAGQSPVDAKTEIIAIARSILDAAYESPSG